MKRQKLELNFALANIEEYNDGFLLATCPVFHAGNNRNRSHITIECAEKMMAKSAYVPVVAEFKEDGFGSHGGRLEIDDEGMRYVDTTTVIGCVLAEPFFMENIDGKDYYCVKVALYKQKYEQIEEFLANHTGQSMEISVLDGRYEEAEDMLYVDEARLDALCVLGNCMPCFQDSAIKYSEVSVEDAKAKFEFAFTEIVEKVKALFEEKEDEANEEPSGEEVAEEEVSDEENVEEETTEEEVKEDDEDFAKEEDEEDVEEQPADDVEEVVEEETEEEDEFTVEEYRLLITNYSELQEKYEALNTEVEELRVFKQEILDKENKEKVDEICSSFNLDEEEIKDLKESAYKYEITHVALEDKLFALMGRKLLKNKKFSADEKIKKNQTKIKTTGDDESGEFGSLTSLLRK